MTIIYLILILALIIFLDYKYELVFKLADMLQELGAWAKIKYQRLKDK